MSTNTMHMSPAHQTLEEDPIAEVHLFLLQNIPTISFHTNTEWPFYTFLMLPSCTMYWKTSLKKLLLELLQRNDFHLSSLDRGT